MFFEAASEKRTQYINKHGVYRNSRVPEKQALVKKYPAHVPVVVEDESTIGDGRHYYKAGRDGIGWDGLNLPR